MVMHIQTICQWTALLDLFELFDLEIKGQGPTRSLWYVTHRLMVMHPLTNYHWPISKDENVMARTRKYYLKNNYLTLRSKVITVRDTPPYGHAYTNYMNSFVGFIWIIWPWGQRSLRYATHHLMVMHPHTNYHWPTSKDKNVMAWTRKYYLKNNYLTLRSKVKVPQRPLWFMTHRLMVMHPHTKYHWPISKDKKVIVWTSFAKKKRKKQKWKKRKKKIRLKLYVSLRSKGRHNTRIGEGNVPEIWMGRGYKLGMVG